MFFHMVYEPGQIVLQFCHNPRVWQTDRRTDRQEDRILIARPHLHSMQHGKKCKQKTLKREFLHVVELQTMQVFRLTGYGTVLTSLVQM